MYATASSQAYHTRVRAHAHTHASQLKEKEPLPAETLCSLQSIKAMETKESRLPPPSSVAIAYPLSLPTAFLPSPLLHPTLPCPEGNQTSWMALDNGLSQGQVGQPTDPPPFSSSSGTCSPGPLPWESHPPGPSPGLEAFLAGSWCFALTDFMTHSRAPVGLGDRDE